MIFLDILNNLRIRDSSRPPLMRPRTRSSSGNFYTSEIGHGIFLGGLSFGPGIFGGVLIFAPIRSSLSLEIQSTSPGFELRSDGSPTRVKF